MGPLLNALGVTIWGLVALGLLAVFIFVGYEAAVKFRSPLVAESSSKKIQADGRPAGALTEHAAPNPALLGPEKVDLPSTPTTLEAARRRFGEAAHEHHFAAILDAGKQLYDAGLANPEDLLIIARAFSSIGDCDNAQIWAGRANDALRTVGAETSGLADSLQCNHELPPSYPSQHHANTRLADRFIKLGEAYYGLGEYQQAVTAIQRGIDMGGASHLDEAYVYLGQSELKLNNPEGACKSFRSLRNVASVKPQILKLWELFADMHC